MKSGTKFQLYFICLNKIMFYDFCLKCVSLRYEEIKNKIPKHKHNWKTIQIFLHPSSHIMSNLRNSSIIETKQAVQELEYRSSLRKYG